MPNRDEFTSAVAFNQAVAEEYRARGGVVDGGPAGMDLLLLTTTGAKSGNERVTPLVYTADGDRYVVCASAGGNADHPAWFHNLVANPVAKLEIGTEAFAVRANVADESERTRLLARPTRQSEVCAEHQLHTDRLIPLVVFERLG